MFKKDIVHLIACTSARLEKIAEKTFFEPLKISSASFKILAYIGHYQNMMPSQLVKELGSTKSNITQRLNFLVKSGLIEKIKTDNGDGRSVSLVLTKVGLEKLKLATDNMSAKGMRLDEKFSAEEIKQFQELLNKFNNLITIYEESI